MIDKTVNLYLSNHDSVDYVSNTLERTYPRGLDTEVFSFEVLSKSYRDASLPRDREHVTSFIYTNPDIFKLQGLKNEHDYGSYRWTVDTKEDFELISKIIESLYPLNKYFKLNDVITLLDQNPKWKEINSYIEQKKLNE